MSFSKQIRRERRAKMFKRISEAVFNEKTLTFIGGATIILITLALIPLFTAVLCSIPSGCAL